MKLVKTELLIKKICRMFNIDIHRIPEYEKNLFIWKNRPGEIK
jgi:hypothetical protein